jgi:cytochrome P450
MVATGASRTGPVPRRSAGFDPFAGPYYHDPAAALAWARRDAPVFYSPRIDSWVVTRYPGIRRVFADPAGFSARNVLDPLVRPGRDALRTLARHGFDGGPVLANEDGPEHLRHRRRLLRPLSRPQVAAWEPRIRELVTDRLDRFVPAGQGDLMAGLLWQLPAQVVYEFLGVPADDLPEAMRYAVDLSRFTWGCPSEAEQVRGAEVLGRYWQLTGRLLERYRREGRTTGWLGHALRAQRRSPDLFDDRYLRALVMNGSTAGHEPVANGAANAVRTLLEHPPAWRALAADPGRIPGAVAECLRFRSPVVAWRRQAVRAAWVDGVRIPAGASVLLVTASGNHDPAAFPDPDRFDPARRGAARHLSFGHGSHRCLGAPLALLQLRVILEELVRRLPDLRLVPGQRFDHVPNTSFFGPHELPVRWDPGRARRAARPAGR